jgi:hypothetical protein
MNLRPAAASLAARGPTSRERGLPQRRLRLRCPNTGCGMCIHKRAVRRACCAHFGATLRGLYALALAVIVYMLLGTMLLSALTTLSGGFIPSPLYQAASTNDVVGVEVLIKQRHSPDSPAAVGVPLVGEYLYSQTPLASAAFQNRPQLAAVLLNAGATADRGRRQGPLGSISSESPLYSAAVRGNYAVLKELLRGGASHVIGQSAGPLGSVIWESPLAAAATHGHARTAKALLEAGADPHVSSSPMNQGNSGQRFGFLCWF